MADLLSILSGAASSLAAQRGLTATASHNIDNANNPSYSRQIATVEALAPTEQINGAYLGGGSTLGPITQARDRFLEAQLPQAMSRASSSTAESDALQAFHGLDPGSSTGLGPALSGFYSSLTALAQNPSDSGLRASLLGAAQFLAQAFNRTASDVEANRTGLDAQAAGLVGQVSAAASAVAELNARILQARGSGAEPNDLLDLRQQHLDTLAQLTGATPVPTSQGSVDVVLPGGVALVAGARAGTLAVRPDPDDGGHLQVTLIGPDGSGPTALPATALGGSLGGTLSARDGTLATAGARIDQLAFDLAGAMNAVHAAGYAPDGSTGLPLFTVGAAVPGAARRMAAAITDPRQIATAASASELPGGGGCATALLATESTLLSGGKDVQGTLAEITSQFGVASATARAFAAQDGAVRDHLSALRQSTSGVSIDQEMITLQQAQRGYEAIAKVIQTADQMLQTLLQLR